MDLNDLQLFCHVAARGSFTGAAEALQLSNGTITRRIQLLERHLDITLINRSTRKMELTESGQALFSRCHPLIQELEGIQQELIHRRNIPAGPISILLPLEFFAPRFSRLLIRFAERFPDIKIHCNHYVEPFPPFVNSGDLCFAWYENALPDSDWIATPLMSLPQACYASPGISQIHTVAALAQCNCITQPRETLWQFRMRDTLSTVPVDGRLQFNSPNMRLQAAVNGEGICKIPCYLGDPWVERGGLQRLALDAEPVALEVAILYRNRNMPFRIRAFIDFFQSHIDQEI